MNPEARVAAHDAAVETIKRYIPDADARTFAIAHRIVEAALDAETRMSDFDKAAHAFLEALPLALVDDVFGLACADDPPTREQVGFALDDLDVTGLGDWEPVIDILIRRRWLRVSEARDV